MASVLRSSMWMDRATRFVVGFALTLGLSLPDSLQAQTPSAPPQTTAPTPLFSEPRFVTKAMARVEDFGDKKGEAPREGFYPELGGMITGSGWIAAGPGYRNYLFGGRAVVDGSAAISWHAYKFAQARLEFPELADNRLAVGSQVLWHDYTQVPYYGQGTSTRPTDLSDYRIEGTSVVGYATWRPKPALAMSASAGVMSRPAISASVGTFDSGHPDTTRLHAADPAAALRRQPGFVHAELSVTADTLDAPGYPTRGTMFRTAWSTYHDRPDAGLAFDRVEVEAAHFLPLFGRGVLAARAWAVFSHTAGGNVVPFYFMPGLGGHNTLRGYADYRFHDRHMAVVNVETRWALFTHVDLAGFVDAGNVAARIAGMNLNRTSVGVGLRLHNRTSTIARLDVGRSAEGWRLMFKTSDVLRSGRTIKRTAPLPFVP